MASEKQEHRCIGCGKPIANQTKVYRVTVGKISRKVFKTEEVFGDLHAECFARSIQNPRTALEELRSIARDSAQSD